MVAAVLSLAAGAACSLASPSGDASRTQAQAQASDVASEGALPQATYPVDPHVHVEDKALDPTTPGAVKARVLNAVAYARYGVQTLSKDDVEIGEDPSTLATMLGALGAASGVPASRTVSIYALEATDAQSESYRRHLLEGAHGASPDLPLSPVGRRIVDLETQITACAGPGAREGSSASATAEACCAALAVPWFLLDTASKLDAASRSTLDTEARLGTLYTALPARRVAEARARATEESGLQPFEHQNIKAFLAVCGPIVRHAPATLDELKARYGDFAQSGKWVTELHPISMAKMAARRIYRSRETKISVAESIGEACEVRETEVIVERPNGVLDFWSFGASGARELHGFFPAKLRVDAVKHTPDACMGCHYKLDSRAFDVRAPSFVALGLELRRSQGEPQWVDGSSCAKESETVIWHARPID